MKNILLLVGLGLMVGFSPVVSNTLSAAVVQHEYAHQPLSWWWWWSDHHDRDHHDHHDRDHHDRHHDGGHHHGGHHDHGHHGGGHGHR